MKRHYYYCFPIATLRRRYSTSYTAKITSTSSTGRRLSVEVTPPLPHDSRGYLLPRHHVVCTVTQILLLRRQTLKQPRMDPTDPFLTLEDYLSDLQPSLTPSESSLILKSLTSPSLALKFFHFCPSFSPNFRHDAFTYARMILILSKSHLPDKLELLRGVVSDMDKNGVRGTISIVNILIGVFGGSQDFDICMELIRKWGLRMNGYSYKCLVQAYLRSRDSGKAFEVYVEMKNKGYKLDIFAYNMLLDALAKDNKHLDRLTRFTRYSTI
ncbi:ABA Overly-Sensitive 5 [Euphorbia peplus]|nr:ABA Overly-Sensitive 5 [Euphorbia peplus]